MENTGLSSFLRGLGGKTVLIAEDEYLLAAALAQAVKRAGSAVMGPFPTVDEALEYLQNGAMPDFAMLDVNLRGEMVFPLADHLVSAGVPIIFVTGYDMNLLPPRYSHIPRFEKPIDL